VFPFLEFKEEFEEDSRRKRRKKPIFAPKNTEDTEAE